MKKEKRRNASPAWRGRIKRAEPPEFHNTLSAMMGGGGGALLGGLLANRGWNPEMVALAMTVGGGVAAYTLGGNLRTAATGLAAAGAGQLALSLLARGADKPEPADKKPSNAGALPPGAIEAAFERARRRLAAQEEDETRYSDAIDVDGQEERAAA